MRFSYFIREYKMKDLYLHFIFNCVRNIHIYFVIFTIFSYAIWKTRTEIEHMKRAIIVCTIISWYLSLFHMMWQTGNEMQHMIICEQYIVMFNIFLYFLLSLWFTACYAIWNRRWKTRPLVVYGMKRNIYKARSLFVVLFAMRDHYVVSIYFLMFTIFYDTRYET